MMNTKFFSLITSLLLLLLTDAAPVSENELLSHPLQKRITHCGLAYGSNIVTRDCERAVANVRAMASTVTNSEGYRVPELGVFNRINSDSRYRLPRRFAVGTCLIFVDVSDATASVNSAWSSVARGAQNVMRQCVQPFRFGGADISSGFNTVIMNEANVEPRMRERWQHCSQLIGIQERLDAYIECLARGVANS